MYEGPPITFFSLLNDIPNKRKKHKLRIFQGVADFDPSDYPEESNYFNFENQVSF